MSASIVVFVTVESSEEGQRIADALVESRFAACVNRVGPIFSTYRWKGHVERGEEQLLIIKTTADRFGDVKKKVEEIHSYTVPEIIAFSIYAGNKSYLDWLTGQVTDDGD